MSDTIDDYKSMAYHKKRMREQYGINCPTCTVKRPKAHPQQSCFRNSGAKYSDMLINVSISQMNNMQQSNKVSK